MGEIQKLIIDGKNYVLLAEEDYEDLIDGLQAGAIMARVAAGEETWPHALVNELCETDSRVRTFRTYRKMTVAELSEVAGVSEQRLAEIEADASTGSVAELQHIAAALSLDLDDLVI